MNIYSMLKGMHLLVPNLVVSSNVDLQLLILLSNLPLVLQNYRDLHRKPSVLILSLLSTVNSAKCLYVNA